MFRMTGLLIVSLLVPSQVFAQEKVERIPPIKDGLLATEKIPGQGVFVHDAVAGPNPRLMVWFGEQFLGDGTGYARRAKEFASWKRTELCVAVKKTLQALGDKSFQAARAALEKLEKDGKISNLDRHWIVNGFSCNATPEGVKALQTVPGVRAIFAGKGGPVAKNNNKPAFFDPVPPVKFDPNRYKHPWYSRYLLADQTWKKLGVTGKGTLNVVHDFNFVFSDNVTANLYRNPREIPGNDKDDDGNGLVDDYHGFNFAQDSASLTVQDVPPGGVSPQLMHGFMCAAIMCGSGAPGKDYEFGLCPEGKWAGVIAGSRLEDAVEWAIEQGADTYSMSFSIPNLGEYRSHWRKVMEHGAFCGVCFVSGAGNFAQTVKLPVQMRVPEDIPLAVFAATGVQRDLSRTPFSSTGPVEWKTHFYNDGLVDEPPACAFNMGLPLLKRDGTVIGSAINGNSFAGPMMGGVIGLMLSADPDLQPWDVRDILTSTALDVGKPGFDPETGHGLMNCYRAVKEVLRRKALRDGKDAKPYEGRDKGDELDVKSLAKNLKPLLRIVQVQPNSQAAKAGIKPGDVLLRYNGSPITDQLSLMQAKQTADAAKLETIPVVIQRDGQEMEVRLGPGPLGIVPAADFQEPVFE